METTAHGATVYGLWPLVVIYAAIFWLFGPNACWAGLYEHFTWHRTRAVSGEAPRNDLAWRNP